jgi:hypothetical protein
MAAPSREGLGARTLRQRYFVPSGLDVVFVDEGEQDLGGYGGSFEDLGQKIYLGRDMISSQQGAIGRREAFYSGTYLFVLCPWWFPDRLHVVALQKRRREEKGNKSSRAEFQLDATRQIEQRAITRP